MTGTNEIKVYTLEEVAELLRITRRTLYSYVKSGKIEAIKIGRYWRVREDALLKFLNIGTQDLQK